jgi:hypothetical protein
MSSIEFTGEVEPGTDICTFTTKTEEPVIEFKELFSFDGEPRFIAEPTGTINTYELLYFPGITKTEFNMHVISRDKQQLTNNFLKDSEICLDSIPVKFLNLPAVIDPTTDGLFCISGIDSAWASFDIGANWNINAGCPYEYVSIGWGNIPTYQVTNSSLRIIGIV